MKRTGATDSLDTMVSPKTPKIRRKRGFWAQGPPWALGPAIPPYFPFGTVSAYFPLRYGGRSMVWDNPMVDLWSGTILLFGFWQIYGLGQSSF